MRTITLYTTLAALSLAFSSGETRANAKDEAALRDGCTWLDRALVREPERDDAFGMFMRGVMPKCQALLEGLARGDKSVRSEGLKAVINEIAELRTVIDAEHGGPPPATGRPTPDEVAKKKVADEKAGIDEATARKNEAEHQAAEQARRAEAEKKAAEAEAKRKEDEARAAAEAERRDAEQRARETAKERKAREAEEKKAEAARKREEERLRKEIAAAEKKAAAEAKREEAARLLAEKKAAEAARKEAAKRAKEQALAESEAKRLIEEAEREAVAEQQRIAREKAAALVEAELASADEEARVERQRLAEESAQRQLEEKAATPAAAPVRAKMGPFDGTWEQPPSKVLDRQIKRTLNLLTKDGKIQGELYEEVWYPAPTSWVDRSCEGNTTFRMVTSARVSGEAGKNKLVLWRDIPRVLTCTCPSRCIVETRRRGFDLAATPDGRELSDASGVFVRPGTVTVASARQIANESTVGPVVAVSSESFVGAWETPPFKRRDETVVRRIELALQDGKLRGTLVERSSQGLPLQSWSDRFCAGATRWEWVSTWEIDAESKGTSLTLRGKAGDILSCSCPSKCKTPKDKIALSGSLGTTGTSLTVDGHLYEKK